MADIEMCENHRCPSHWKCHRYTAEASIYQTYSAFKHDKSGQCDAFWPNKFAFKRVDGDLDNGKIRHDADSAAPQPKGQSNEL